MIGDRPDITLFKLAELYIDNKETKDHIDLKDSSIRTHKDVKAVLGSMFVLVWKVIKRLAINNWRHGKITKLEE